ncbi:hypothetical protein GJ700_07095 [Duganella sp. FT92W]|uniref:DUF6701 domain-containing protein n=1 Tax=Pseudoduganella rivuli TaxID=2666085 RepID=A0A7X2IK45_9BURK|nr:DUF6701 domain-containing protein [Pseudoduganella rivuli]MRV71487.1 hypothetical protein [Pseudoduganella rivuli]
MNQTLQVESGPRRLLTTLQAFMLCVWMLMAPPGRAVTTTTTYTLPAALTSSPFNCTLTSGTYVCGSINLDKDAELKLTSDVDIWVKNGSFTSQKNLTTNNGGHTLSLSVDSYVTMQKDTDIDMNITASGSVSFAKNARIDGNITSSSNITFAKDSTVNGNVTASGNLTGAKNVIINGSCIVAGTKSSITCTGGSAALHHVRVTTTGTTTACGTTPVTITACNSADSNGTCTPYTGGISGTLNADALDDSDLVSVGFSISSGNSSVTVSLPTISTPQTASLSFSSLSKTASTQGTCWNGSSASCDLEVGSCGAHHVRLNHAGSGVTCIPATVTINACSGADTSGTCIASTAGMTGTLVTTKADGSQQTNSFMIPAGSSSVTQDVSVTTSQTVTFGTTSLSPGTTSTTTCWNGSTADCTYFFDTAALVLTAPDHTAASQQSVDVRAVKQSDTSMACTSALANGDYSVEFGCSYNNPSTGTQGPTISSGNTSRTMACSGSTSSANALTLTFSSGKASLNLSYPDAGQVTLLAKYSGSGLLLTGSDPFVAAPAKFVISNVTSGNKKAGNTFSATVQAVNNAGAVTPNFGRESTPYIPILAIAKCQPTFTGSVTGVLTDGATSTYSGTAYTYTFDKLTYSEVGTADLTASLAYGSNGSAVSYYLNVSPLAVTGTTQTGAACGAVGPFTPAYFETSLASTLKYTYSGQPITSVIITPKNAYGATTVNYTGVPSTNTFAKAVTLTALDATGTAIASTVGSVTAGGAVAASSFTQSTANATVTVTATATPTFSFAAVTGGVNGTKPAPQTVTIRATDTDGVSSAGHTQASVPIRLGRLRLFNTYGTSLTSLKMPVQAEYWNGTVWVVNGDDSTTSIPAGSIGFPSGGTVSASYTGSAVKMSLGKGTITITSGSNAKGYTDVTTHLGAALGAANACPSNATRISGANLAGLRSYHGCDKTGATSGAYDYDPTARANFGLQSQETKGVVHVREVFN